MWSGKYSFILSQEVLGSSPLGYRVAFVIPNVGLLDANSDI